MDIPNFENFLDKFNELALQPALKAGKEKLDEAISSTSTDALTQAIEDAYYQMSHPSYENQLNALLDTSKVEAAVDGLKAKMQDPETSLQIAAGVKNVLNQTSNEQIADIVAKATKNAAPEQQFTAQFMFMQLSPMIDELRTAKVEDVAAQIQLIGASIDSQDVASQVSLLVQEQAEKMNQQARDAADTLPPAADVSNMVQELGNAARDTLDKASQGASFNETVGILKKFSESANQIIVRTLGNGGSGPDVPPSNPQAPIVKKDPPSKKKKGPGKNWKL